MIIPLATAYRLSKPATADQIEKYFCNVSCWAIMNGKGSFASITMMSESSFATLLDSPSTASPLNRHCRSETLEVFANTSLPHPKLPFTLPLAPLVPQIHKGLRRTQLSVDISPRSFRGKNMRRETKVYAVSTRDLSIYVLHQLIQSSLSFRPKWTVPQIQSTLLRPCETFLR